MPHVINALTSALSPREVALWPARRASAPRSLRRLLNDSQPARTVEKRVLEGLLSCSSGCKIVSTSP